MPKVSSVYHIAPLSCKVCNSSFILLFFLDSNVDFVLQDADVVTNCLSALNALASFHYSERSGGKEGLGAYAAGFRDPSGNMQRGILSHFLQSLLHLLVFENYRFDTEHLVVDNYKGTLVINYCLS